MTDLASHLKHMFAHYRPLLPDSFRWEDEADRWHELAFSLLSEMIDDPVVARQLVSSLGTLNLLDFDRLASLSTGNGVDFTDEAAATVVQALVYSGIARQSAEKALSAICTAAAGIRTRYGSLPKFLRANGERMLRDLQACMSVPENVLAQSQMTHCISTWLQNVLEMPFAASNPYVEQFCKQTGITLPDLVRVADEINVNAAVLDDIIQLYMADQHDESSAGYGTPATTTGREGTR